MKCKRAVAFFLLTLIFAAALFISGGCGGSSGGSSSKVQIHLDGKLHGELAEYLPERAVIRKLTPKSDGSIYMLSSSANEFSEASLRFIKEVYDDGAIVAVEHAGIGEVNAFLKALGETPNYAAASGDVDPNVEIYAMAKRGKDVFTYVTRSDNNVITGETADVSGSFYPVSTSEETVSEDVEANAPAEEDGDAEETKQQRLRVANFIEWTQSVDDMKSELAAAREVADGDNDLTKLAQAQVVQNDCSYRGRKYLLTYTIYACHSFTDKRDYYLVQSSHSFNPESAYKKYHKEHIRVGVLDGEADFVEGYNSAYLMDQWINEKDASTADIFLLNHAPENVNRSKTKTTGFSWEVGGNIGFSGGKPAGGLSGGVSFSSSEEITIYDYDIYNQSLSGGASNAKWNYDIQRPSNGGKNFMYRHLNDAPDAARRLLQPHQQWIWAVASSYRSRKGDEGLKLNASFRWTEGWTRGAFGGGMWIYEVGRIDTDTPYDNSLSIPLRLPPLIAVDKPTFDFDAKAQHSVFNFLSEKDWTIESDSSWCVVNKKSGRGTGDTLEAVMFDVDANESGESRTANIKISDGVETSIVEVMQSKY